MKISKSAIGGLILIIVSIAFSIVLVELVLRSLSNDKFFVWQPGISKVFKPDADIMPGIHGESLFSINEHGLRGDSFSDHHKLRILTVGGSTTECLYLDNSEAWPKILQDKLNKKAGLVDRIWVGNVGKSGHTSQNHVVQVEQLINQYPKIDLLIILVGVNDFVKQLQRDGRSHLSLENFSNGQYVALMDKSFSIWPRSYSEFPSLKRTEIWKKVRMLRNGYLNDSYGELQQDEVGKIYTKWRKHRESAVKLKNNLPDLKVSLDDYASNLKRIILFSKSEDIEIVLVTQPYLWHSDMSEDEKKLLWMGGIGDYRREKGHLYYTETTLAEGMDIYNERLLSVCVEEDIHCIDLASQISRNIKYFYDDVHFNENGSEAVAELVSDKLVRYLPVTDK